MTKTSELSTDISNSKNYFGFWVYLMTDCVLFATLFATFIVLRNNAPDYSKLFSLPFVLTETLILLTSSLTSGLLMLSAHKNNKKQAVGWLIVTFLLGVSFLGLELSEFNKLITEGNGWRASGFLSSYFTLISTHGLHIFIGLIWICTMLILIYKRGLSISNINKLSLFSLYWHFLDIIWIFIFTVVYLMGSAKI